MRLIDSHKVPGDLPQNQINIVPLDRPGSGGANHLYEVGWSGGPEAIKEHNPTVIKFQEGPIKEVGINGLTNEALLAIVEDRLKGFQSGPYACRENAIALTKIQESLMWLQSRTIERIKRGVEGTLTK